MSAGANDRLLANGTDTAPTRRSRERRILLGILFLGLLHGMVYLSIMPPWQHYEEPSHYEFVWLIATHRELPEYPASDQAARREIVASMIEHDFYEGMGGVPIVVSPPGKPLRIGYNVSGSLPLYHILVALPLSAIPHASVETQLILGRLVSLVLLLGTVGMAYLIMAELFPEGHLMRIGVPLIMVLLPGFLDLMTAVNNDVGATFVFSLFLWLSVRLMMHGVSLGRGLAAALATGLCLVTKTTLFLAGPLFIVALVFAALRHHWRWSFWLIPLALGLAGGAVVVDWGDAAFWYRDTTQENPTSLEFVGAPWGERVLGLGVSDERPVAQVSQPLLPEVVSDVRGEGFTVGAWLWASEPTQARLIVDLRGATRDVHTIEVGTDPAFYAFYSEVPTDTTSIWVSIHVRKHPDASGSFVTLYSDGAIVAKGELALGDVPAFETTKAQKGRWGGQSFVNLLRNPSVETRWLYMAPWITRLARRYPWSHYLDLSTLLASMLDWGHTGWLYLVSFNNIVDTFWAKFGWAHVALPSVWWYRILRGLSLLSIVGMISVVHYARKRSQVLHLVSIWFIMGCVLIWGQVLIRGFTTVMEQRVYIPTARYGYPAVVPTLSFIGAGLGWLTDNKRLRNWLVGVILLSLVVLDVVSIVTIIKFYGRSL